MAFRRRRHRRWIALIALLGLLFQQLAMAAYVCPIDGMTVASERAAMPSCDSPAASDPARCGQHCHPLTPSFDQSPQLTVPPLLPATTWVIAPARSVPEAGRHAARDLIARATAPPLNIQHCTFQI